jgi:formylglycine-generating enzyme
VKLSPPRALGLALATFCCQCQVIAGYQTFEQGEDAGVEEGGPPPVEAGSPGSPQGDSGGPSCVDAQAPSLPDGGTYAGAALLPVALPGGRCAWVDATEVSQSDYGAFLAANPNPTIPNEAPCGWKGTSDAGNPYAPSPSCLPMATTDVAYNSSDAQLPQVCIDTCDALAFCAWAGKSLCQGTLTSFPDPPPDNPWFAACSPSGEVLDYPYGGTTYESDKCNGANTCPCALWDVGSTNACLSPNGAKDQSGNVAEMSNDCERSQDMADECLVYGGNVGSAAESLTCGNPVTQQRGFASDVVGFRCCVE